MLILLHCGSSTVRSAILFFLRALEGCWSEEYGVTDLSVLCSLLLPGDAVSTHPNLIGVCTVCCTGTTGHVDHNVLVATTSGTSGCSCGA